jgi:hypothetical protein
MQLVLWLMDWMVVLRVLRENMMIQRITRIFSKGIPLPQHQLTMPSRCGTGGKEQEVAVPWVAGCICFGEGQGNHTPSPGAELRQGEGLRCPVQWCRECEPVRRQVMQIVLYKKG